MSPTIVELVGAPGSGKTTLIPAVLEACGSAGLSPYTAVDGARRLAARTAPGRIACAMLPTPVRARALWAVYVGWRLWSAIRFAAAHPALVRHVVGAGFRRPPGSDARERRVLHWYLRMAGAQRFARDRGRDDEALVLDEGFVHRVVQLRTSGVERPDGRWIEAYAALIPRPDVVVHVRAPVDACVGRVRARGAWPRFGSRPPSDLDRFVANAHLATALAVEAVRRRGWTVVEVDNEGDDPGTALAALRARLAATLRAQAIAGTR